MANFKKPKHKRTKGVSLTIQNQNVMFVKVEAAGEGISPSKYIDNLINTKRIEQDGEE